MSQPEIRVRVQQLRASRRGDHQTLLDEAAVLVEDIITDAMEKKSCGLALRAVEFRLKLGGVIQDRRIAHHYHLDQRHPDADLENLDPAPQEEFDALPRQPAKAIAPKAQALPAPVVTQDPVVTRDSDLPRFMTQPPASGSLLGSTAMAALMPARNPAPAPRFRLPHAA
jgi:phage terminase small subunit